MSWSSNPVRTENMLSNPMSWGGGERQGVRGRLLNINGALSVHIMCYVRAHDLIQKCQHLVRTSL